MCGARETVLWGQTEGIRTTEIKGSSWGPGVACKPHVGCRAEPLSGEMADSTEGLLGRLSQARDPVPGQDLSHRCLLCGRHRTPGLAWPGLLRFTPSSPGVPGPAGHSLAQPRVKAHSHSPVS